MPAEDENFDRARKNAAASVKTALAAFGLELAQCGLKSFRGSLDEFDQGMGYWTKPTAVTNKPPRWIVWLEQADGRLRARVPEAHGADRLAFANTGKGKVGGLFVRVIPAVRLPTGGWRLFEEWEWVLYFVFPGAVKSGSAAQLFDGFDPATGALRYMGADQPYAAAGLLSLRAASDSLAIGGDGGDPITYGAATEALRDLIQVAPLGGPDQQADSHPGEAVP